MPCPLRELINSVADMESWPVTGEVTARSAIILSRDHPLADVLWRSQPGASPDRVCDRSKECTTMVFVLISHSSWSFSSLTPKIVPAMLPDVAKKTGLPELSNITGDTTSVSVRVPDACVKRWVPLVI